MNVQDAVDSDKDHPFDSAIVENNIEKLNQFISRLVEDANCALVDDSLPSSSSDPKINRHRKSSSIFVAADIPYKTLFKGAHIIHSSMNSPQFRRESRGFLDVMEPASSNRGTLVLAISSADQIQPLYSPLVSVISSECRLNLRRTTALSNQMVPIHIPALVHHRYQSMIFPWLWRRLISLSFAENGFTSYPSLPLRILGPKKRLPSGKRSSSSSLA